MQRLLSHKLDLKKIIFSMLRAMLIIGISFVILQPLLTKISSSLMSEIDVFDQTVRWIPRNITFENYTFAWEEMNYPAAFLNSLFLTVLVSFLQLFSTTFIGYGLARFEFKGSNFLFALVIFALVVPPQLVIIPMYLNYRFFTFFGMVSEPGINLLGSYWPFILTSITGLGLRNGLFIYIMRQFFRGMPRSLEEAAHVDGAGLFKTFFKVMLPGALPGLIIVFLFSFVWQWNDYFFITLFMRGGEFLPNVLAELAIPDIAYQQDQTQSLVNNAGSILFMAPLLLLYAFMQRYFIESVQRTGIIG